ncbi:MAG: PepSY domain-containing protein [Halioglobus sp.]
MMRKTMITLHMYVAAFFAPAVLLVAITGGLYLLGVKGSVEQEKVYSSEKNTINPESATLHSDVAALLADAGVKSYHFEYIKVKGSTLYTRPTSREHYIIKLSPTGLEVIHARPSLQNRMMELHKGHGPSMFKTFQTAFAVGLLFIILSGLWLGVSAARLRRNTLLTVAAGTVAFTLLLL